MAMRKLALRQPRSNRPGDILEFLSQEYREALTSYCMRLLGNRSDAEDACSKALLNASNAWDGLKWGGAAKTWIYRIATNVCIDVLRIRSKRPLELLEGTVDTHNTAIDLQLVVREAVQSLPEDYRIPVILADLEDLSAKEAAIMMGISVPAFKSRLYRGRRILQYNLYCVAVDNGRAGYEAKGRLPQSAASVQLRVVTSQLAAAG